MRQNTNDIQDYQIGKSLVHVLVTFMLAGLHPEYGEKETMKTILLKYNDGEDEGEDFSHN